MRGVGEGSILRDQQRFRSSCSLEFRAWGVEVVFEFGVVILMFVIVVDLTTMTFVSIFL